MTANTLHVVACGTSTLTNYRRAKAGAGGQVPKALDQGSVTITPDAINELKAFISAAPEASCAEVNSLVKFGLDTVRRVYLLNTDTDEGEICALALERWLREQGLVVDRKRVEGFGTDFARGLSNLRNAVVRVIRDNAITDDVYLNCTGGFKPEASMLVLVASVYDVPAYYIYETSKELVMIPPLPVDTEDPVLKQACMELKAGPLMGAARDEYVARWAARSTRGRASVYEHAVRIGLVVEKRDTEGDVKSVALAPLGKAYLENYELGLQ